MQVEPVEAEATWADGAMAAAEDSGSGEGFWHEAPTEVVAAIIRHLDLVSRTCTAPHVSRHWWTVAAQVRAEEDDAICADIRRRHAAHADARGALAPQSRRYLDRQFAEGLSSLFQEHALVGQLGDPGRTVRLMDGVLDCPERRRAGCGYAPTQSGGDAFVELTLEGLCELLDRGATADECQRVRLYPDGRDCEEGDVGRRDEGEAGNVAALFVSAVLSLNVPRHSTNLSVAAWRQRRLEQFEAVFLEQFEAA